MILIEHAVVVSMDAERRIFRDGAVLVDGRDILQVGRTADERPPRAPDRVIDGRNRLVLPGFVNTHVHLSEHVNRGVMADEIPVDRYMTDWLIPVYSAITTVVEAYSARLASVVMIRTGTTKFC
jgi:5-methylthioadenosine/S-adenosylhomocysteine deaminase